MALTFGAMPVPATVVAEQHAATIGAGINVTAQSCRAAPLDGRERAQLPAVEPELVYLFA